MFKQHVTRELSAFAHGELRDDDSRRVSAHLLSCDRCQKEFEEIKFGMRLAESLPSRTAPASLWDGIEASLRRETSEKNHPHTSSTSSMYRPRLFFFADWQRVAAVCGVLLCVISAGIWWSYKHATRSAWDVARLEGAPTIDDDQFGAQGSLRVGQWLETDGASRAKVIVANIGQIEVDPGTRIRLVKTRLTEHRLELARGRLHAIIWAPPRLFFVETPSAVAADLGCAYTLEVDERGRSLLRVTSGWVALEAANRESIVPAGGACITEPGTGPGTPFFEDASETFVEALAQLDFEMRGTKGEAVPLNVMLDEARPRDTLTLWHLLSRVEMENRSRVYERLAALAPPPAGVTRDGVMKLDEKMLALWKDHLEIIWIQESIPAVRKVWRSVWEQSSH